MLAQVKRSGTNEALHKRTVVDQNYRLEHGGNREIYASQVDAAGQIRSAGLEAAKLRQAAAVIAAVGREISGEVEQGMRGDRTRHLGGICHSYDCSGRNTEPQAALFLKDRQRCRS